MFYDHDEPCDWVSGYLLHDLVLSRPGMVFTIHAGPDTGFSEGGGGRDALRGGGG